MTRKTLMSKLAIICFASLILVQEAINQSKAEGISFGLPKAELVNEKTVEGRKVLRYEHQSHADWGYSNPQRDYFNVVPAATTSKQVPLRVILHGAGKSGDKALEAGLAAKEKIMHFYGDPRFCVLYLDCRDNSTTDWWWGYHNIKRSGDAYTTQLSPTEKRILSTVEWVIQNYNVDRNRVYLSGVSMGGSGTLGIGMCRGDVFAAINVAVPAGVEHMLIRMKDGKHPEPPPVVNFSSHIDGWSKGQEEFLDFIEKNKCLTIYRWGLFGHTTNVRDTDSVVNEFPWLDIVKNEAYPAFTGASTNQEYPGFKNKEAPDQEGQINGYFRWRNIEDTPKHFAMELRLVTKKELTKPLETPETAITDITLRRLQSFQVTPSVVYKWSIVRGESILQQGEVQPDSDGLLTIKGIRIEDSPSVLTVEPSI